MRRIILTRWGGDRVNLTKLFAGVPDDVVLAVSARDLELDNPRTCLCGWAVRESLAQAAGIDADEQYADLVPERAADRFGGTSDDWYGVFYGVTNSEEVPLIEEAWTQRVMQAAGVLS